MSDVKTNRAYDDNDKKKEEEYRALLLSNDNKMRRGILLVVAVSFTPKRERDLSSDSARALGKLFLFL